MSKSKKIQIESSSKPKNEGKSHSKKRSLSPTVDQDSVCSLQDPSPSNSTSDSPLPSSRSTSPIPQDQKSEAEIVETEVLSHKERRKRRKLASQPAASVPLPIPEPLAKPTRSRFGVWVGNMLYSTTTADVEKFFSSCGPITRLHMPPSKSGGHPNGGFAYVDFDSAEALERALEKSESLLGGRKLLIKRSTDYTGRPSAPTETSKPGRKILERQRQPPAACLFLGNLGFETTAESIGAMFRTHHSSAPSASSTNDSDTQQEDVGIRKVRMGTFEDSGKCKGFGFVDFVSIQAATRALTNPLNHLLDGRQLKLEFASADAVRRGGGVRSTPSTARPRPQTAQSSDPTRSTRPDARPTRSTRPTRPDSRPSLPEAATPSQTDPENSHHPSTSEAPHPAKKAFLGRLTPGAALANARRAPTGIVKNPEKVGKKIVFE